MRLHIGCGSVNIPMWSNVDIDKSYDHITHIAEAHDLPLSDNMYSEIYASHILEYYDWSEAKNIVLPEWKRVLKHNGILRLAVPNFKKMIELYSAGLDLSYFIGPLYGKMEVNNGHIYHKTTYDEKTLTRMLIDVGFTDVKKWDWRDTEQKDYDDYSRSYIPHMDFERGTLISLNIQCKKG